MRLTNVILRNYRGYSGEHTIHVESDLTALVGKNDAGKSTLLEALEIFFGDAKPSLEDLNIHSDTSNIEVGCIFSDLPPEVTVDTSSKTTLSDEYLVNENGDLEVVKRFACTDRAIASKPEVIVRAIHPSAADYNDLLRLKLAELKERGTKLGATPTDSRASSSWREAIRSHASNLDLIKTNLSIEDFDTKVKSIYSNLEGLYPQYFIFRVDRQTSDNDSEAKDPMQLAVKEAQKEYQAEMLEVQKKIQLRVEEVTARALEKLHEMDASLATQLVPVLKSTPKWTFDYKIQDDRGVSLNKRGSGTRRLVLLNFFRAEAERKSAQGSGNIVYAVEEPETSQHPRNQHLVIKALLELAADDKRQVLVTTHSPQLLEDVNTEAIRFLEYDEVAKNVVTHVGEGGLAKAADSLGILANQTLGSAKAVVIVEGESDEVFLNHAADRLAEAGHLPKSLEDAGILILPAGSCDNIPFWVQKLRLERLGLPHAIFLDSDRMSVGEPTTKNEQRCLDFRGGGKIAITTKKREIENYIDPSITGASFGDFDDAKAVIATQNTIRESRVVQEYWVRMDGDTILTHSEYVESGTKRYEILEILEELLSLSP